MAKWDNTLALHYQAEAWAVGGHVEHCTAAIDGKRMGQPAEKTEVMVAFGLPADRALWLPPTANTTPSLWSPNGYLSGTVRLREIVSVPPRPARFPTRNSAQLACRTFVLAQPLRQPIYEFFAFSEMQKTYLWKHEISFMKKIIFSETRFSYF